MKTHNKKPVDLNTTIDPELKLWAKQHNVNMAQVIRLALLDLKEKKFTIINLREVLFENSKEKPLKIEGVEKDATETTE